MLGELYGSLADAFPRAEAYGASKSRAHGGLRRACVSTGSQRSCGHRRYRPVCRHPTLTRKMIRYAGQGEALKRQ
ncbi:hypothetical protein KIF59_01960 [Enterobacter cloacae subsp. cloacae]|nr:hypothetical protein [Enterobacter cloacae subsp. cloacae]